MADSHNENTVEVVDLDEAQARARVRARLFGEPLEPVRIGRFVVVDRIGSGAMGVVYSAYDSRLDRKVALKFMRRELMAERGQHRLLREARAMAQLSHANVVTVHEAGTIDGSVFIAMEHVDGVTLREWCEQERSLDETLAVLIDAGRGLAAAHAAGVTHGDFKPDNVLIDDSGRVRVVDFGLASGFDALPGTEVAGTPSYMAPEQFNGATGVHSDQFAFAVTAYECLFGVRPFDGVTLESLKNSVHNDAPRAPERRRNLGRGVRGALIRALSAKVEARFDSMDFLLAVLVRARALPKRRRIDGTA
ncbi:MAG: serine/threonine-protein kinase [Myxococcota bacterium]